MQYIVNVIAFLCTFDIHVLQKLHVLRYSVVQYRMLFGVFSDTAYCRNPCTEKWFKYDDDHVSEIKESDVKVGILLSVVTAFIWIFILEDVTKCYTKNLYKTIISDRRNLVIHTLAGKKYLFYIYFYFIILSLPWKLQV